MISGVDVSAFQSLPADWRAEAGSIDFAAVKMSELSSAGSYISPDAAADWAYLKTAAKGRIAYMFGHPGMSAPATVALFAGTLRTLGIDDGDAIALDLETTDGLRAAAVADWSATVLGLLEREFGRSPLLYTFLSFAEGGNCAGLGKYPLWIADPSSPAGHPRVPAPWKSWAIHQYSSAPIDRDIAAYASLAAFRLHLGKAGPPPLPTIPEDLMLLTRGAGAVTPCAVPSPCKALRLYCAEGSASLEWNLVGEPVHALVLTGMSSEVITLPANKHAVKIVRKDAGTADVCVVAEA